jgi:dienelactone hydrolase
VDGSVQYFCLLPPKNYDPKKMYGLIISCHGAGVEASGLADAYKPKDWAFVVAATNRRRFGFDWQDWGRLDLLEVRREVTANYPIDENRVHLTGHSMGGHGTWYNGFTSPDIWASMSPSAGWTTFPLYVPYFLRRNEMMGSERMKYIFDMGMQDDNTLVLSENAMNIPVFAVEGGADDDVPMQQPRLLVELLKKRGYDVKYWEVPGMPHWWDDPKTPELDCVDSTRHNEFWKSHVRSPFPEHVFYRTHNYSNWSTSYWITIDKPERVCDDIIVDARITGPKSVVVKTTNVEMFRIENRNELFGDGEVTADVDGQVFTVKADDQLIFEKTDEGWRLAEPTWKKQAEGWHLVQPLSYIPWKSGRHYGPWKQAFYQPFLLVAGTQGTPEENDWNLHMARMYAARWWYQGNGFAQIVRDTDVAQAEAKGMNLILFGGPESNALTKQFDPGLPIHVAPDGVNVGDRFVKGDLAVKFVFPNPADPSRQHLILVQEATSLAAAKRLPTMNEIFSGAGYPDWMVWGKGMDMLGLGGVSAAGYFDLYWNLDDSLSFYNNDEDR